MDSVIQSLKSLFTTYGFSTATIVLVTIVVVNLFKRPITSYAIKFANEHGVEKSVITRYVTYLPFAFALLLTFLWASVDNGFNYTAFDWSALLAKGLSYGALAIATYETVKKQLQAYAAKKNAETLNTLAPSSQARTSKNAQKIETAIPASAVPVALPLGAKTDVLTDVLPQEDINLPLQLEQ